MQTTFTILFFQNNFRNLTNNIFGGDYLNRLKEYGTVYFIGAIGYGIIETLWRGYTHWTMLLTGGMCLLLAYLFNKKYGDLPFLVKCLVVCTIITSLEFIVGCIINLGFGWNVWDYSHQPYHLLGQICLEASSLWLLLSIPIILLNTQLEKIFSKKKLVPNPTKN